MPIQRKDIAQITKDLDSASLMDVPGAAHQILSNRQTIRELAPVLLKKKKEGFTTAALVALLKNKNVHIKDATLNRYLKEWQADEKAASQNPPTAVPTDAPKRKSKPRSAPKEQTDDDSAPTANIVVQDEYGDKVEL